MKENEYGVTFHGDFFSLTVNVQGEFVGDDHLDVATDLAANILKDHYGWDVKAVSHEIDVYCEYADDPIDEDGCDVPIID